MRFLNSLRAWNELLLDPVLDPLFVGLIQINAAEILIHDFWQDETELPIERYSESDRKLISEDAFIHIYRAYPKLLLFITRLSFIFLQLYIIFNGYFNSRIHIIFK